MTESNLHRWDFSQNLEDAEHMAAYLRAAMEEDVPGHATAVLEDIVRALGVNQLAKLSGLDRDTLFEILNQKDESDSSTFLKIAHALHPPDQKKRESA